MVLAFARQTGVAPARIAMVGDSTHDLDAARHAGAVAIAVLTGPAGRGELSAHADHVIDTIEELPRFLDAFAALERMGQNLEPKPARTGVPVAINEGEG